jgi:DNA-binding MarR family transcriptional regulator
MKAVKDQRGQDAQDLTETLKTVDYILHRKLWQKLNLKVKPGHVMLMVTLTHAAKDSPQGLRVSELASAFNVTASGVTQLVGGLEERGYICRRMDPEDRRAVRVSLTETGRRLAESLRVSVDAIFSGLVEHLGHEKSRKLLALLTEVTRYFDGLDTRDASNPGETEERS